MFRSVCSDRLLEKDNCELSITPAHELFSFFSELRRLFQSSDNTAAMSGLYGHLMYFWSLDQKQVSIHQAIISRGTKAMTRGNQGNCLCEVSGLVFLPLVVIASVQVPPTIEEGEFLQFAAAGHMHSGFTHFLIL